MRQVRDTEAVRHLGNCTLAGPSKLLERGFLLLVGSRGSVIALAVSICLSALFCVSAALLVQVKLTVTVCLLAAAARSTWL